MIDRSRMRRIRNIIGTTVRDPRRHLRTVATDELVRKIVREIHSRRHGHSAIGISAIANNRSAVRQNYLSMGDSRPAGRARSDYQNRKRRRPEHE